MILVDNVEVFNFEGAIRGMRNPMNSWDKSDSYMCDDKHCGGRCCHEAIAEKDCNQPDGYHIGKNDLDLMKRLYKASLSGDNHAHRKYLRQISVSMDITAPLYWWKEFDTYKVGVTANSCSTMHKIAAKEFELDDFSHEHLLDESIKLLQTNIEELNSWRCKYLTASKIDNILGEDLVPSKKTIWWQMIQLLPSSYNQKRTVTMNYENAVTIIKQRTNHKLDEWNDFVEVLHGLPYIDEIVGEEHPKHVQLDTLTKVNYSKDGLEEDLETIRKAGVRCCGTCHYYRIWNGVCVNGSSDHVADFVSLDFECDKWEEMKNA